MKISAEADQIGSYHGFDLFYLFHAQAVFSARVMAYLLARSKENGEIAFAQVACARRDLAGEMTQDEVERRLAVDVISRAKLRILDSSYQKGQVYTMELDALTLERAG